MWSLDRPEATWIKTNKQASRLKEKLAGNRFAAIDTETTGLRIDKDDVIFWSLSTGKDRYFLDRGMLDEFQQVFKDPKRVWIGTHTKYDAHMLANSGFPLRGDLRCTLVMDRMNDPENDHGLKETYERYFGEKVKSFGEVFYPKNKNGNPYKPKGKSEQDIILEKWDQNPRAVVEYASLDAWMSYRVYKHLKKELRGVTTWRGESLWDLYLRFEVPFTKILYACERMGVLIDEQYLNSLKPAMEEEIFKAEKSLNKAAGTVVNVNSPPQLRALFIDKLKLKSPKKTPGGAPSTDKSVMEGWANQGVKEAKYVLRHRKVTKIMGTYIDSILQKLDSNGRLHGSLNQHVAETARLSSNAPNLQNIPRPGSDEFKIRRAFIPRPGYKFVAADYSQLEMYLMAHWSGDVGMIQNIKDGKDMHAGNAALVWEEPYDEIIAAKKKAPEDVTERDHMLKEYRQFAKVIGFGLNYGKGARLLASELGLIEQAAKDYPNLKEKQIYWKAVNKAEELIRKYFDRMPQVEEYIKHVHEETAEKKYVETLVGRRRWLRHVMDMADQERHHEDAVRRGDKACWCKECAESRGGDRQSVNTIIQGCLPSSTRVLTDKGMLPIGSIPNFGTVWTGTKWSKYTKLNRGSYERAEIGLDNGQILQCDARHKVLTVKDSGYEFSDWSDLKPGTKVCLSMPNQLKFGGPPHKSLGDDQAYWLGFFIGNGSSSSGDSHKNAMTVTFGDRKGRYSKEEKSEEFIEYIEGLGHTPQKPSVKENKISITVESKIFKNSLVSVGYPWGSIHNEKVVPTLVWSSSLSARKQFLLGLLDSDGYVGGSCPNLHMVAEFLLREIQILARTVGVESRLHGPYANKGQGSWRLDFNKVMLADLGYGEGKKLFSMEQAPPFIVKQFIDHMENVKVERGSDATILSRMRGGGSTSVHTMRKLCQKYGLDIPIYSSAQITYKRVLGFKELTYTLSVDDPMHRFDSEGVISKNSAADVVQAAMIKMHNDDDLVGCNMLFQVHDEVAFEVPEEILDEACAKIKYNMENCGINGINVPLKAEPGIGSDWVAAH